MRPPSAPAPVLSRRSYLAATLAVGAAGRVRAAAPDSLDAIAQTKGLRFGAAVGTGANGKRESSFDDPRMRDLIATQCGIIVPENELKWVTLRPDPVTFDFSRADRLRAFADDNKLLLRGHTLLWNEPTKFPSWFAGYDFGPQPRQSAERLLRTHINTVCGRYGERIFSWDVINETIARETGEMRDTPFTKHLGPSVVDIAFHAAREAAPKAQLVYNDYMSWEPGSDKHRAGVLRLLERMKKTGVPVDALGLQSHVGTDNADNAVGFAARREGEWRRFLDDVVGMGLDLAITEFDVHDKGLPADIPARDQAVADFARAYLDLVLSYRQVKYVMAWGMVDRYSWLQDRWPRDDNLPKRPCPYDADFRPKLLRTAMADAFRAAPVRG